MKRKLMFGAVLLVCAALLCAVSFAAGNSYSKEITAHYRDINLVVHGDKVIPKDVNGKVVEPFIVDGTTYLPVRAVSEALGKTVEWDDATSTVSIKRQDGERFNETIIMEGMEETVRYEHIINKTIGFEMDYDYESFVRNSESDMERFVSIWDDQEKPENYLKVTYSTDDAETAAGAICAILSVEYDIIRDDSYELDRAGSCTRIEASEIKGTGRMADQIQVAYVIPAGDGCIVARAYYAIEAAEGCGHRFHYMMDTLEVIDRTVEGTISNDQALSAVKSYCYAANPDLKGIVESGEYSVYWTVASSSDKEIVVLFRSYTGAQIRYHVDRNTGETYATELVPGTSSEEKRTDESFNVKDYL